LVVAGQGNIGPAPEPTGAEFAYATAAFLAPDIGTSVQVPVNSTANFVQGQNVYLPGGFDFLVTQVTMTMLTLQFLGLTGDSAPGGNIPSGSFVLPATGNQTNFAPIATVSLVNGIPTFSGGFASQLLNGGAQYGVNGWYGHGNFSFTNIPVYFGSVNVEAFLSFQTGNVNNINKNGTTIFSSIASGQTLFNVTLQPGETLAWGTNTSQFMSLIASPI
jgi:hypothetical protein